MRKNNPYNKAHYTLDLLYNDESLSREDKKILYHEYLKLLRKTAYKSTNPDAMYELALTYEDINFWGVNKSYAPNRCFYWYSKACNLNHADACNSLATMYLRGISCQKNVKTSLVLFEKALRIDSASLHIRNNYISLLHEINSAILTNILFYLLDETVINELLYSNAKLTIILKLNSSGKISSIERSNSVNLTISILEKLETYLNEKKPVLFYNKITKRKRIMVSFPKILMRYYDDPSYNDKQKSKLDYLKQRMNHFLPEMP